MLWISTHCAIDAGSLVATKLKKLRIAASRQLRVPIVPPRSCSACLQEPSDLAGGQIGQHDHRNLLSRALRDEPQEQPPGVAVGSHRMDGCVALLDEPFVEERPHQFRERVCPAHGCTSRPRLRHGAPTHPEPLVGVMKEVLRDGDVDQGGVDIPMAKIGREERQAILRVDARPIPFEDPVHDHRVT